MTVMVKETWAKKDFKVLGGRIVEVTWDLLNSEYNEPTGLASVRTFDNGLLELFRLTPKLPDFPFFIVRWDQRDDSVDVDLRGEAAEIRKFAMQESGYRGHKTQRVSASPRTHALDIEIPGTGPVFRGVIALNLEFAQKLKAGSRVSSEFQVNAVLVRNGTPTQDEE